MNSLIMYFKESIKELKKVVWPTREETIKNTFLVMGVSILVAVFLGGTDYLLNIILGYFIS